MVFHEFQDDDTSPNKSWGVGCINPDKSSGLGNHHAHVKEEVLGQGRREHREELKTEEKALGFIERNFSDSVSHFSNYLQLMLGTKG